MILNNRTACSYQEAYCSKLSCSCTHKAKLYSASGSQVQIKPQSASALWNKIGLLSLQMNERQSCFPNADYVSMLTLCWGFPIYPPLLWYPPWWQLSFSWAVCAAGLWAAFPLGSWNTCLEVLCRLAASLPGRAWCGRCILTGGMCSNPPAEEPEGALGSPSWDRSCWAKACDLRAWAFSHLTAASLVLCLLHHAIYSWMFLCTSVPTLIAWCCIIVSPFLFDCCLLSLHVLVKTFTIPRRR